MVLYLLGVVTVFTILIHWKPKYILTPKIIAWQREYQINNLCIFWNSEIFHNNYFITTRVQAVGINTISKYIETRKYKPINPLYQTSLLFFFDKYSMRILKYNNTKNSVWTILIKFYMVPSQFTNYASALIATKDTLDRHQFVK